MYHMIHVYIHLLCIYYVSVDLKKTCFSASSTPALDATGACPHGDSCQTPGDQVVTSIAMFNG